jgi:sec-independent protein translocase protein TatB
MFEIGWGELLIIGIVALIAIGPKELPGVLRTLGQWMSKLRRMASEFQSQFHEAMREAELADLKKQVGGESGVAPGSDVAAPSAAEAEPATAASDPAKPDGKPA